MAVQQGVSELIVDVVVVARDCARALETTLERLPRRPLRSIVVVDNGSQDATGQVGRDRGAIVLRSTHGGYGTACLRALRHLESLPIPPNIVIFMDPRSSEDPMDVPKLLVPFQTDNAEMVLATRDLRGRRTATRERAMIALIGVIYGHQFSEFGSLRAVRFSALVALGLSDKGGGMNVEMLVKALRLGLRIVEVPVGQLERAVPARRDSKQRHAGTGRKLFQILRHATAR